MKKIFTMLSFAALVATMHSCSSSSASNEGNPFFAESWDTPFNIPPFDQIKIEHYMPAFEEGIKLAKAEINAITSSKETPSFENTIEAYINSGEFLTKVSTVYNNLCSAELTDELSSLQLTVRNMLTSYSNEVSLNDQLFAKIKSVYENRESMNLSKDQLRLVEKTFEQFAMNGANLPADKKEELKKINQHLSSLTLKFKNNVLQAMKDFKLVIEDEALLEGLPQAAKDRALKDGKWVFSLDKPSMIPFLQNAKNSKLREQLYDGYLNRCDGGDNIDNKAIIDSMVNIRAQRAQILGFNNHAEFTLKNNMAKTPENVYTLLNELWTPALKRAERELKEMKAIKVKEGDSSPFTKADWWYYAERLREQKYKLSDTEIAPYLSLEATREGIFTLCNKLYGITFTPVEGAPVYHKDCQVFECHDSDGTHLGALMMDFHPRPGKGVGAWCTSYRPQSYKDGKRVAPIVSIVCNFSEAQGDQPALLTLDEVETFFHEFGHGLHSLFSDVKVNGLRGVSRDFVELPSQIMENWATTPELLKLYAKHYKTGEVIPDALIEKIQNAQLFNQGFATVEYLGASFLDMDYHTIGEQTAIDVTQFEIDALTKRNITSVIAPRYRSTYFQHIFAGGYSSGYYSYIWSEVLDADAFQAFVESGDLFNKDVAKSFRDNVLSVGGSRDEIDSYKAFRGREADKQALLKNRGLL